MTHPRTAGDTSGLSPVTSTPDAHANLRRLGLILAAAALASACFAVPGGRTPSASAPPPSRPVTAGTQTPRAAATPSAPAATNLTGPTGPTVEARVTDMVDGDTIHVSIDGRDFRVRYIGMNAPELDREGQPAEAFARESLAANRQLVKGETVTLEKDVSQTDQYGRLLRYVWLHDGDDWLLVNAELVRLGFAHAGTYPPDVKYTDLIVAAEREARDAGAGLWAEPPVNINPIAQPIPKPDRKCDPSYPDVCIAPPPPPDLNCDDVPFQNVRVIGRDPHDLDGNNDGVGCES